MNKSQINWKKIIDIVQWVLIVLLIGVACFIYFGKKQHVDEKIQQTEESYVKIYESQKILEDKIL